MKAKAQTQPVQQLRGVVTRISPLNMVYVSDESTGKPYAFAFNAIRGYRGESPREMKLKPGRAVRFSVGADERVQEVELL